jgi:hypothetical protein
VELGGGDGRALGALVLFLAPPAGHAGERLTAPRRLLKSSESEEAATLAGCHYCSEVLTNQKRLRLAEVAGYAERS